MLECIRGSAGSWSSVLFALLEARRTAVLYSGMLCERTQFGVIVGLATAPRDRAQAHAKGIQSSARFLLKSDVKNTTEHPVKSTVARETKSLWGATLSRLRD